MRRSVTMFMVALLCACTGVPVASTLADDAIAREVRQADPATLMAAIQSAPFGEDELGGGFVRATFDAPAATPAAQPSPVGGESADEGRSLGKVTFLIESTPERDATELATPGELNISAPLHSITFAVYANADDAIASVQDFPTSSADNLRIEATIEVDGFDGVLLTDTGNLDVPGRVGVAMVRAENVVIVAISFVSASNEGARKVAETNAKDLATAGVKHLGRVATMISTMRRA